ncbi:MAG: DUF4124 domain-containing protein [Pseudomonadota bacterium]
MRMSMLLLALACAGLVQAQTMYRWVDQDGKVHYGDRPPQSGKAADVQERKYSAPTADRQTPATLRQAAESYPVTLYVAANCTTACADGRNFLNKRGIPFSEKTLSSNEEIAALREKLGGGETVVPVLQVGEKTSRGYLESAWAGLLDAAGYPKAKAAGGSAGR